jgi:hypothetical protein
VASRRVSTRRNEWAQVEPFRQDRAPAGQARRPMAGGMTCRGLSTAPLGRRSPSPGQDRMSIQEELAVLLVGIDWAERHHDVCLMATDGRVLTGERIVDGVAGWLGCMSSSPGMPATRRRWWSGSRSTGGCWSGRWSRLDTRWWQLIRWRPAAIGSATRSRGPSRIVGMRGCWLTWSAPTVTITVRWPRLGAGGGGQGAGPRPPTAGLGSSTAGQHCPQRLTGLLPGGPGCLRQRPWKPGCGGRAAAGPNP